MAGCWPSDDFAEFGFGLAAFGAAFRDLGFLATCSVASSVMTSLLGEASCNTSFTISVICCFSSATNCAAS